MEEIVRVFYYELDSKIYVGSEELFIQSAERLINDFQKMPPTSDTDLWGPDRSYVPFGITLSPTPMTVLWKDGKIPVFDPIGSHWYLKEVTTQRLYLMEELCFYSGRDIWPNRPALGFDLYIDSNPKNLEDPISLWVEKILEGTFVYQFKSSGNVRRDLKQRLFSIRDSAKLLYEKWDDAQKLNPDEVNPFDYHISTDTLSFQIRRVLDEIVSLLFVEIFRVWLREAGTPTYLDSFASLFEETKGIKKKLFNNFLDDPDITIRLELLKKVFLGKNDSFLKAIQTLNNAAKHSFHNSDFRGHLGTGYPTILALAQKRDKHRNGLVQYSHSLPQILGGLEDFLIDLIARVSSARKDGDIDLSGTYISDSHKLISYTDLY